MDCKPIARKKKKSVCCVRDDQRPCQAPRDRGCARLRKMAHASVTRWVDGLLPWIFRLRNTSIDRPSGQKALSKLQRRSSLHFARDRCFDGCILLTVLTVVAISISSFEMARHVFQMDVPRLELATLDELFDDLAREFERSLGRKLETLNHPRLSLCKSERSFDLPVHRVVFSSTLAAKFRAAEHLHSAPSDALRYGLGSLRRLRNLVGNDCQLVKRNSSGDWSVLSPIAVLSVDVESEALFAGELVLPLTGASGGPLRVFRFDNSLPLTNVAGTTLRHTPTT